MIAAVTRSRLSFTALSGNPTVLKGGKTVRDVNLHLNNVSVNAHDCAALDCSKHVYPLFRIITSSVRQINPYGQFKDCDLFIYVIF